ncbi:Adaptive-response sensory-kinase SasA [Paenibacillus solanacearum]|uniref:histidine kinase n=1 Tax=Paenibacillus solanacearum TaxID=2048548 RepID=A0A916NLI7_9BACL|nr:ATP-binding protein [Paenibacillus solanacearum]CAG7650353.1 Adaptive-response sensory-kinase SasA [Paenibacillus solanacearum]
MLRRKSFRQGWLAGKIYKRLAIALLLLLALGMTVFAAERVFWPDKAYPRAANGTLDLTGWNWQKDGTLPLNGEWSFSWKQLLLTDSDAGNGTSPPPEQTIKVPGSWNGTVVDGTPLSGEGYATYRLTVLLPEGEEELALRVPAVSTSYKLWVNGKAIASTGQLGTTEETAVPQFAPEVAVAPTLQSEMEIVIEVANFSHQRGGLRQPIELGAAKDIIRTKELAVGFDMLLIGCLLIMGLYHMGLFAVRTKEMSMLYFGLFCLLFGIRMTLLGEIVITKAIPGFNWTLEINLEYLSAALSLPLFILFFSSLYPKESSRLMNAAFCILTVSYSVVIAVLPTLIFTQGLVPLQLVVVAAIVYVMSIAVFACIRKREGSGILLISCLVLGTSIVNDMLYAHQLVATTDRMSAFGLLIFIFSQAAMLSIKLSRAFVSVEKLSSELTELNNGLHEKIAERTYDLEQANEALIRSNDELSRLETSRSHLISNISHDLGTPMTTIQCYIEAILDRMVDSEEQQERYLRVIHSKVVGMDRLIEDLFQLSQLEARQVAFKQEPVTTDRLIERLFARYELDARGAGIEYTLTVFRDKGGGEGFSMVEVDTERLHQAYSNLIFNAIKFTPSGGTIAVEMHDNGSEMRVSVSDSGSGIRPEDLPYVFDRFYTSNKARNESVGGKGLGLSISKEIVEYHGGRIWVERTGKQRGTVICFTIPTRTSRSASKAGIYQTVGDGT